MFYYSANCLNCNAEVIVALCAEIKIPPRKIKSRCPYCGPIEMVNFRKRELKSCVTEIEFDGSDIGGLPDVSI